MFTLLGSSIGAFLAAKRSHFAILAICTALALRKGTTNDELLRALGMLCGSKDWKGLPDGDRPSEGAPGRRGPQRAGRLASKALKSLPERCEADG
jgi:hypothetical protein